MNIKSPLAKVQITILLSIVAPFSLCHGATTIIGVPPGPPEVDLLEISDFMEAVDPDSTTGSEPVPTSTETYTDVVNIHVGPNEELILAGLNGFTLQRFQTLSGTGTVTAPDGLIIDGTHAPGNSPGLQYINGNTVYSGNSVFSWELIADTTAGRGTNYDGVDIKGSLKINAGATFELSLNGTGSSVDFTNSFWSTSQTWVVFQPTGSTTGQFTLGSISPDSNSVSASSYGSFSLTATGGTINLMWSPIVSAPEPGSLTLIGVSVVVATRRRRISPR